MQKGRRTRQNSSLTLEAALPSSKRQRKRTIEEQGKRIEVGEPGLPIGYSDWASLGNVYSTSPVEKTLAVGAESAVMASQASPLSPPLSLSASSPSAASSSSFSASSSSSASDLMLNENPWLVTTQNNSLLILSHEFTGARRAYIQKRNGELDYLPFISGILNG